MRVSLNRCDQYISLPRRTLTLLVVMVARLLATQSPHRIRAILCRVRIGADPATYAQAKDARDAVVTSSLVCAGEACLPRSIATALLCRLRGTWPTWCVGARLDPFRSHAWVEAEGSPVDEPFTPGHYHRIMVVEFTDR
jgi:Transglutaminase-like superfamily